MQNNRGTTSAQEIVVHKVDGSTEIVVHQSADRGPAKFSKKFKSYCNNYPTIQLRDLTERFLRPIFKVQNRAFHRDRNSALGDKRYVIGFKEIERNIPNMKLLIIAPDIDTSKERDGLEDVIKNIIAKCEQHNVPYVFSLQRHRLGNILAKKMPIDSIGILNDSGSEENLRKLLFVLKEEKERFKTSNQ